MLARGVPRRQPLDGGTSSSAFDINQVLTGGSESTSIDVEPVQDRRRRQPRTTSAASSARSTASRTTGPTRCPADVNRQYREAKTVIYSGADPVAVRHGVQPDRPVLLPVRRARLHRRELLRRAQQPVRRRRRRLAQEYVVAHEYGHHVENILGILAKGQDGKTGPQQRRRADRADGRLHGRRVGQPRVDHRGRRRQHAAQAADRRPTSTRPCRPRPRSATTTSRRSSAAAASTRTPGPTARASRARSGS